MPRANIIALFLATVLGLAACGEGDVASDGREAAEQAEGLAEQLRDLEHDVRSNLRGLDDGTAARARAMEALDDAEQRARDIAREARETLPDDEPARRELERAAERLEEAARLPGHERAQAEDALADARDRLGEAVDAIDDRFPESAREGLDELRRSLDDAM